MIRPLRSNVLVKVLARDEYENKLNLIVVDKRQHWESTKGHKQSRKGEVLAVGPYVRDVKAGDVVVFDADAGQWVDAKRGESELYRNLKFRELEAVLESNGGN